MNNHFFDQLSIELLFLLTFLFMVLTLELGFQLGLRKHVKPAKAQTAQVRALMGAALGLLAFMLAFTFSASQSHFENRIQFMIDESILAKNAFMQADLATEPVRTQSRELLLELVNGRVKLLEMVKQKRQEEVFLILKRSQNIHLELWSLVKIGQQPSEGAAASGFDNDALKNSVLKLMEIQTLRVQAALVNRIPLVIWLTLYFTAVMSMVVVGYQAGLTERRSPVATFSLALAFSAVMILIMDLDRPLQSLFALDVAVMEQLAIFMRSFR